MNCRKVLLYLTNNERHSRHEEIFDVIFFIVNTIALLMGAFLFSVNNESQWIPVLAIEYMWAFDNLRHNRS